MDDAPKKLPLDYATPARPKHSPLSPLALVLGVVSGMFGAAMLYIGLPGIIWLVRDWNNGVDGGDVVMVVMFNLIGAFCVFIAIRWVGAAFRDPGPTARD